MKDGNETHKTNRILSRIMIFGFTLTGLAAFSIPFKRFNYWLKVANPYESDIHRHLVVQPDICMILEILGAGIIFSLLITRIAAKIMAKLKQTSEDGKIWKSYVTIITIFAFLPAMYLLLLGLLNHNNLLAQTHLVRIADFKFGPALIGVFIIVAILLEILTNPQLSPESDEDSAFDPERENSIKKACLHAVKVSFSILSSIGVLVTFSYKYSRVIQDAKWEAERPARIVMEAEKQRRYREEQDKKDAQYDSVMTVRYGPNYKRLLVEGRIPFYGNNDRDEKYRPSPGWYQKMLKEYKATSSDDGLFGFDPYDDWDLEYDIDRMFSDPWYDEY